MPGGVDHFWGAPSLIVWPFWDTPSVSFILRLPSSCDNIWPVTFLVLRQHLSYHFPRPMKAFVLQRFLSYDFPCSTTKPVLRLFLSYNILRPFLIHLLAVLHNNISWPPWQQTRFYQYYVTHVDLANWYGQRVCTVKEGA